MQEEGKRKDSGTALLFELRGGQPGSVHPLSRDVFRIGSGEDNHLVLKDRDVQLKQLEISLVEDRYVLRNVSSEGSVFLNGEPFEESTLQKGDILTVGESMFRYVDQGETLSQEDLWRPVGGKQGATNLKRLPVRRISFLAALVLIAAGAGLVILFTQGKRMPAIQPGTSGKLTELEKPVDRDELKVDYEQGKDLLAARRWDQAILKFEGIRRQIPSFMDLETLYQEALFESGTLELLNTAKGLVLENELFEARGRMEQIPRRSVYYREAERLIREIDDMMLRKRLQEAMDALANQDWFFARREAESILAKYPNNKEARRILLEARLLQRQLADKGAGVPMAWSRRRPAAEVPAERAGPTEEVPSERETKASAPDPSKSMPSAPGKTASSRAIQSAIAEYCRGRQEKSFAYLEKVSNGSGDRGGVEADQARALAEDVRYAMSHFQQAKSLQQEGRYSEAVEVWERFLERDRSIAGDRGGTYFRQASAYLAQIYLDRGKREFDLGNPIGAAMFWKMGRKIHPGDEDLRRALDQLDDVALRIYREGYSLQEINLAEAMERWNEVLMILPPEHPYYRKAKNRIDRYAQTP